MLFSSHLEVVTGGTHILTLTGRTCVSVCVQGAAVPHFLPSLRNMSIAGGRFAPPGERFGCYRRPKVFLTGGGKGVKS